MSVSRAMPRAPHTAPLLLLLGGASLASSCQDPILVGDLLLAPIGGAENRGSGGTRMGEDGDGGGGGGTLGESPPERPRFGPPRVISELSLPDSKEQDPTLTADLLEIFFFSDRSGDPEIWTSLRADPTSRWAPPTQVLELSDPEIDINPAVSRDGLRLWFYSQREPGGIYFTERSSREDPWSAPARLDPLGGEIAPGPSADELRMGVSVIRNDEERDIYESTRANVEDPWNPPVELLGINGPEDESTPYLIGDGTQILFSSARTGLGDLYWARRTSLNAPVVELEALEELNTPEFLESHPHLSPDGMRIFFGSARSGNTDLYEAERTPH